MAHKQKYSWLTLVCMVAALAIIGYFVIHRARAANADITGDGRVDTSDFSILATHYGQTGQSFATGDLNGDGRVDISDLSILAANWGATQTGAFMSYPVQTTKMSVSGGSNVVISNKSFRGITGSAALTVSGATNVYIHDIDFDSNSGDIFLINVSGTIRIENIRARNTGTGTTSIGSGLKNVIQFNNTWQDAPASDTTAGIRNVKVYGGPTEDMLSFFRSGGRDAQHPLIIENNHLESPLPGSVDDALAWTSSSGTCINTADDDPATGDGGHDMIVRNNTLLNCGIVGLQMNRPLRVTDTANILYGAARPSPNNNATGLSQWSSHSCAACIDNFYTNNRVWWLKPDGTRAAEWYSGTAQITRSGNVLNDTTIDPNSLKVSL